MSGCFREAKPSDLKEHSPNHVTTLAIAFLQKHNVKPKNDFMA
jgi:hypothetical protein